MDLCFPSIANIIDWAKPFEWLDTEFQKITHNADQGLNRVDKLVKVSLKDQSQSGILLHIEIQCQKEVNFEKRIYLYNCRIYGRYEETLFGLVVYGDPDPDWQPSEYKKSLLKKTKVSLNLTQ